MKVTLLVLYVEAIWYLTPFQIKELINKFAVLDGTLNEFEKPYGGYGGMEILIGKREKITIYKGIIELVEWIDYGVKPSNYRRFVDKDRKIESEIFKTGRQKMGDVVFFHFFTREFN